MAFTYTDTLAAARDQVRFLIGDTDTVTAAKQIFTDNEVDGALSIASSDVYGAAARCMLAIASSSARIATLCNIGNRDFNIDRKQVAKECREQAKEFFKQSKEAPSATEVYLEDEDLTYFDSFGFNEYNFDTGDSELNT